ncbi:hypothetical protein [Paraferrimonas sedimenticola]|uniref:Uncharacterized protein n=1 Tax=Paraferrimonas sedimenticola TaxID=375674 RepID=A0AA37W1I7_9GAMM|nr:hypothetical protein [Paraferrimonas sedimenticola]GLP96838.1 hypothetical protein GCM10007895_21440 [Paraferrimonas sedimenticola]
MNNVLTGTMQPSAVKGLIRALRIHVQKNGEDKVSRSVLNQLTFVRRWLETGANPKEPRLHKLNFGPLIRRNAKLNASELAKPLRGLYCTLVAIRGLGRRVL